MLDDGPHDSGLCCCSRFEVCRGGSYVVPKLPGQLLVLVQRTKGQRQPNNIKQENCALRTECAWRSAELRSF